MFWEQASINGSRTWTGTLIYLKVCDVKVWCLTKLRFNSVKKKKKSSINTPLCEYSEGFCDEVWKSS